MKDDPDVIRITKWIDGELNDTQIDDLSEELTELESDRQAIREMGEAIREQFPPEMEVPFGEIFNRQILRRIEEERKKTISARIHAFFSWMTTSEWALPATAATALVVLLLVGTRFQGGDSFGSRVVHTFTPNPAHAATTVEHRRAGVTVVDLKGLEPLPASEQVVGYVPVRSSEDVRMAKTIFYDEKDRPLLVLTTDASGEPHLEWLE